MIQNMAFLYSSNSLNIYHNFLPTEVYARFYFVVHKICLFSFTVGFITVCKQLNWLITACNLYIKQLCPLHGIIWQCKEELWGLLIKKNKKIFKTRYCLVLKLSSVSCLSQQFFPQLVLGASAKMSQSISRTIMLKHRSSWG